MWHKIKSWLIYQCRARTKYYLHSPSVYGFYRQVLDKQDDALLLRLKEWRQTLSRKKNVIYLEDFGSGRSRHVPVSTLEKNVAVKHAYGRLLYYLVKHIQPDNILEIGTNIGISSAYMALAKPDAHLLTLEGSKAAAEAAAGFHDLCGLKNIRIQEGEFSSLLENIRAAAQTFDLIFIDGNHRYAPTMQYFNTCMALLNTNGILLLDDIYWSPEMTRAWEEIKAHPQVTLTIDVYQYGVVFLKKEKLAKEHFVLRY